MEATQELIAEHNAVLVALQILERITAALAAKSGPVPDHLEQLLDFFKGFVDRCHHGKEEEALFPALERCGVPRQGGPIGVMLMEHEAGRGYVKAMAEGLGRLQRGEAGAAVAIGAHAVAYCELLRGHIHKENHILFAMADRLVPADAAREMLVRFEAIERERVGEGKHEAYHAMLRTLKEAYGVT
jgi:hemerythrin-like domain-containing protein